jgi:serine/threonine protein kinase
VSRAAKKAEELDTLVGTTIAGRYRIDALLGKGGMGAVFRAHHLLLKRDVAVKILHPELVTNEDISKRFDREAQSAARLDHPNVIPVTEFGSTEKGMKYMVMQLLSGRELSELLNGPIDPLRAIELEIQILRGLEHAHGKGVVHRDLKPENVFVTRDHEGNEILKLVDFGIAKIVDEDETGQDGKPLTRMGLVFGTPHYMSPEQATGMPVDQRTDIYSAGVLLYQMLAGRLPFEHDDPVSLIRMQVTLDPPPLPDTLSPRLTRVVSMMMAKSRDQRYPDARSARKALQAVQAKLQEEAGVPVDSVHMDSGVVDVNDIYPPGFDRSAPITREFIESSEQSGPLASDSSRSGAASQSRPNATVPPILTMAELKQLPDHVGIQWLRAIPKKWWKIGGGVLGLLVLIALIPQGGDDEDSGDGDGDGEAVVADEKNDKADDSKGDSKGLLDGLSDTEEQPKPEIPKVKKPGIDEATLIAIDQALTSKNKDAALDLIRPARDKFPEDPQLLWREGKALAMDRAKSSKVTALERYGEALELDAELIDNPDFYGELNVLLRNSAVQEQAIDLALQKLGAPGHKFLLELVNVDDPSKSLGWVDRHRALTELRTDPESFKLVDWRINYARDLYQAGDAPQPCTAFRDTLDTVAESKDAYYIEHLLNESLAPPAPTGEDAADLAVCGELPNKLVVVRDLLTTAFPEEAAKYKASGSSKKKKKKGR